MSELSYFEKQELGSILEKLAATIDLTEAQYREANEKYTAVGNFISHPNCILAPYDPKLVSQGSMRIGTVARPADENCEFDVDGTLRLQMKLPVTQYQLKKLVGDCFKSNATYERMLIEKNRCWRLKYHEASRFHLDAVPAIPDDFQWLLDLGVPYRYACHAVRITDKHHPHYYVHSSDLPRSNPEGYALWFLDVMKIQADAIRMKLAVELKATVESIPEYRVRTPLQRAVQLMKRHRDIMYSDSDLKPISVIITTLAARSYADVMRDNPGGLFYDIVLEIVRKMPDYIQTRSGVKWIVNPVNPNENFADKWASDKKLEEHFYKWHKAFLDTLLHDKLVKNYADKTDYLRLSFGTRTVNQALNTYGEVSEEKRRIKLQETAALLASGSAFTGRTGNITAQPTGVANAPHRFHLKKRVRIPRKRDYRYAYLTSQQKQIEKHYDFLKCRIENNVLKCTGWIQPEGCKEAYKILIEYVVGREPKTTILHPDIQPSKHIHMYRDKSLCLCYAKDIKWNERTNVYAYTVPWVAEWLVYYELYLVNGNKWEGPESPDHLTEATINVNKDEYVEV
jgi:hypothetical protein